jgi:hypothetical protein
MDEVEKRLREGQEPYEDGKATKKTCVRGIETLGRSKN